MADNNKQIVFKKILDLFEISSSGQIKVFYNLNEALGYRIYIRYREKFVGKDKEKLEELITVNDFKKLIAFIIKRTNKKELEGIIKTETENIIKDFVQEYLKRLSNKKREEVIKKIENLSLADSKAISERH
ncbi:MAG: hypothetical protein M1120_02560 [Patescibacteria group bacterium]|nr:hypothetical protein [Patescibacteria group bacterium]